jgi:golgin subfamily B member 1
MTISNNHSQRSKLLSLFQRGPQWHTIDGYRVEDLTSEQPVWVTAGSTMLGNIIAPQIKIGGMVHGAVVAHAVTITGNGQVWGNVYSASLNLEAGGAVYGWISSIDQAQYDAIWQQGTVPDRLTTGSASALPSSTPPTPHDLSYMDAFDRLRQEAANAKAARAELEHTFEKRLSEIAGETAARALNLRDELSATRTKLSDNQQQVTELTNSLQSSQEQVERQTEALAATRALLDEQNKALAELQNSFDEKNTAYAQLDKTYRTLDSNFIAAQQEIDELSKKVDSLEGALQNNLQHSAEQEASLIRWQELAEDYQKQIGELENQLESSNFQAVEHSRIIDKLRTQRDQLEEEWQQAHEELMLLRERETQPLSREELAFEKALIDDYKEAQEEIEQLRTAVSELAQYEDQVIWYQADLETARAELQQTRAVVGKQEIRLSNLQEQLNAFRDVAAVKQDEAKQLKQRLAQQIEHTHSLETELKQKVAQLEARLTQEVEKNEADRSASKKVVQKLRLQLEAAEMELERHLQEATRQGQHLAEIQSTLIEREITMNQLKQTATARAQTIIELKEAARKHIETLTQQLAKSQKQVQDLKAFIERKHKKGQKIQE